VKELSKTIGKDASPPPKGARLNAYHEVVQRAKTEFDSRYPQYKYLQLLVSHADHQQHGYGKDLVESFISKARQTGGVLTALGGPSGYIFFSGLGFHDLGPVSIPEGMSTDTQLVKMLSLVVEKERRRSLTESVMHYLSS
jgi:GNAT superfamily N-acetyltransferase